ncbi:MAG TPA: PqiC family protein [Candidatus Competibacteraceae bacterium]|nr:PqiC family protein [Candidatus Competibacteraceae bacterium]
MKPKICFCILIVLAVWGLLAGCSSAPTHFYILTPLPVAAEPLAGNARQNVSIGLGPVALPDYLDRPQIVTRLDQNQFKLADFDYWSEPLKDNFTQVLAEDLSLLLGTERVFVYPWRRENRVNYQVTVNVIRFDRQVDGDSVLIARWRILRADNQEELRVQTATYTAPAAGSDYPATVAAMNQTLTALSRDIAGVLKGLVRSSGP